MADSLTKPERARRYLEASMASSYTGLPAEHREAHEGTMRHHEARYKNVRQHALAGTDADFDEPLSAGAREHQRYLRKQEKLTEGGVREMRKELRGTVPSSGQPARRRSSSEPDEPSRAAGVLKGPRKVASAGGKALSAGGDVLGVKSGGNVLLKLIGVGLLLSLIYLLVAGKGVAAVGGIVTSLVNGVRAFVAPVDPIAKLQQSLGAETAKPVAGSSSTPNAAGGGGLASGASVGSQSGERLAFARAKAGGTAPAPSKVKVKVSRSTAVRGFNQALAELQARNPNLKVSHLGGGT
jgi:hypothetical protein